MGLKGNNYDFLDFSFERDFNILYAEIHPTIRTGIRKSRKETQKDKISNLAIYDIKNEKLSYFFEEGSNKNIKFYLYESSYNEEFEKIDFNTESYLLSNNMKIEKRELEDKLFVITEKDESEEFELWISSKLGLDKKLVRTIPKRTKWRIDVYNKKILILNKIENGIKIESLNW